MRRSQYARGMTAIAAAAGLVLVSACGSSSSATGSSSSPAAGSSSTGAAASGAQAGTGGAASAGGAAPASGSAAAGFTADAVAAAQQAVDASVTPSTAWDGPTSGPAGAKGKFIAVVGGTLQNGGVIGVISGLKAATAELGWKVQVFDGQNTVTGENSAMSEAINVKPDAIVIVGFPYSRILSEVQAAHAAKIPLVGWHATGNPGPTADGLLFTNVTSQTEAIGKLAGQYAVATDKGNAHVAVLTDTTIPQTLLKANSIKAAITACSSCSVLATESFPFATISTQSPQLVTSLLQRFSTKLTDIFSINDLSFDASVPALQSAGVSASGQPHLISAGDGSASAFQRIRTGSYQTATVAEPLLMHGWQVVDELNREFAGQAPSTYVTKPHLVIKANVDLYGGTGNLYDPPNGYQAAYKKIWGR